MRVNFTNGWFPTLLWLTALSTGYFLGSDCCSVAEVSFDYVISVYLFVRFKEVIRLYVQLVLGFKLSIPGTPIVINNLKIQGRPVLRFSRCHILYVIIKLTLRVS